MTEPPKNDQDVYTIEVSARVHEHLQAMTTPKESPNETLERLLGLTPDPATVAGDELSTPLPEDPVLPDALATDPTTEATAVDPADVPDPEPAPADVDMDVDASLGELAAVLGPGERAELESLLEAIDDADADTLEDIVDLIDEQRETNAAEQ